MKLPKFTQRRWNGFRLIMNAVIAVVSYVLFIAALDAEMGWTATGLALVCITNFITLFVRIWKHEGLKNESQEDQR